MFDIEDEMDTALDTHEYSHVPVGDGLQRRYSQKSQKSQKSQSRTRRPSSNAPERIARRDPSPNHLAAPSPRLRLGSMLNRGAEAAQSIASPLAQIFQPLIVDDDIPEESENGSLSLNVPMGISYGPASRRKQSMMQRSPAAEVALARTHRFPSMGSHESRDAHQVSTSPDPISESVGRGRGMETAEEAEEEEEDSGGMIRWMERLDKLEQGQKRIEDLLLRISENQAGQ